MFFHVGNKVIVLFQSWNVSTIGGLIGTAIAWFAIAFLYEGVKVMKEYYVLKRQHLFKLGRVGVYSPLVDSPSTTTSRRCENARLIIVQFVLQAVQLTLAYFMMLVAMTYNVWLFIAVVIGSTIGSVTFSEIKLRYPSLNRSPQGITGQNEDHCF